jgi:hypothetical protein
MFKGLRDALERALAAATPPPELGAMAAQMREAVIEQKAAVRQMQEDLARDESTLASLLAEVATAERRRGQAEAINDAETVSVAEKYLARQRERLTVLERKVAAQREELALAQGDLTEMTAQLAEAAKRRGVEGSARSANDAWNSLGAAGMDRPGVDTGDDQLRGQIDRQAREAAADAKLEELKKKMGR